MSGDGAIHRVADLLTSTREAPAGSGRAQVLPTGFDPLDEVLTGGLRTEQLTLVGGRPGIGKTILTLQWARTIASGGATATVVCYEHSPREILDRLLALEVRSIARPDEEFEVDDARRAVLGIGTTGAAPSSPLAEEALRRVQSYGTRLHLVAADGRSTDLTALDGVAAAAGPGSALFVDYLQKVPVPGALHDEDRSRTEIGRAHV